MNQQFDYRRSAPKVLSMCYVLRSGPDGDDPCVQTVALHHPAEGEAAEGCRGAAGHRRCFSLPLTPQGGSQTPPPALQTLRLRLHGSVLVTVQQSCLESSVLLCKRKKVFF